MKVMRLADVPLTTGLIADTDNVVVNFSDSDEGGVISFGNLIDDIAMDLVDYLYGDY